MAAAIIRPRRSRCNTNSQTFGRSRLSDKLSSCVSILILPFSIIFLPVPRLTFPNIVSVSAVAVGIVIILAFSPLFRTVIWSPLRLVTFLWYSLRLVTFFIAERTQAYRFWLWLWSGDLSADPSLDRPSERIGRRVDRYIEMMEVRVRRGRRARTLWRGEQAEGLHHV